MRSSHVTKALLLVALALAALAAAQGSGAHTGSFERFWFGQPRGQYVPGEVIVGFRAHASRADVARVHGRVPARVAQRFSGLRMQLLKLKRGTSVQEAIRRYQQDPAVAFAEPNHVRYPTANLLAHLWGLNNTGQLHPVADSVTMHAEADHAGTNDADIDAPEAWGALTGSEHPIIAVIDTGVDIAHPDLVNQIWENPGESPNADASCTPNCDTDGVDTDDNGFVDDVHGYDFAEDDGDTLLDANPHFPGFEHGTHVAGIIAGDDDADGIVGVCPGCEIMVLKIARDSDGLLLESAELAALAYAHENGAKIANMSFGGPDWSNAEREVIRTSGLLAVVSAGNDALDNDMYLAADIGVGNSDPDVFSPSYPASFTLNNILAVGASNDEDRNAYSTECFAVLASRAECAFTNWGHDSIDLAAPGVDIESSVPGGFETFDGTSMAAPHVAGTAGLVLSQNPTYTVAQLKNALMRSVDKPTTLRTIYIPSYLDGNAHAKPGSFSRTAGRINANNALNAGITNATPLSDGNIDGAKGMSKASVTGSVSWPADINDVKKKRLSKGHVYRLSLVVPARKDYDLFVWKPGTKEIWQIPGGDHFGRLAGASVTPRNGADEVVKFKAGSTGTYYFHISAWLFKSGSYRLTLKKIS
jgi:subtilisin family serine protease